MPTLYITKLFVLYVLAFHQTDFTEYIRFIKNKETERGGIISNPLTLLALIYSPPLSPRTYPILSLCIPLYPSFTPFRPIVLIFFISFLPLFHLIHPSTPSPLIHSSPPPFFNFHSPLPLSS